MKQSRAVSSIIRGYAGPFPGRSGTRNGTCSRRNRHQQTDLPPGANWHQRWCQSAPAFAPTTEGAKLATVAPRSKLLAIFFYNNSFVESTCFPHQNANTDDAGLISILRNFASFFAVVHLGGPMLGSQATGEFINSFLLQRH